MLLQEIFECNGKDIVTSSNLLVPYVRRHSNDAGECTQHRRSDVIEFPDAGKTIQKSNCLRHSQRGCITFSGIDLETGQLLYITEWMIKYSQLELKCATNCKRGNSATCHEHGVDEVIAYIKLYMASLTQIRHKNLVHYEFVKCEKKVDGIFVCLAQDFVLGNNVSSLSTSFGWCGQYANKIARSAFKALKFLHSKCVTHGLLQDTTVFIDNCSIVRVTDFALVPYLQNLISTQTIIMKNDMNALGLLIESLCPTPSSVMRDFIVKCMSHEGLILRNDYSCDPLLHSESKRVANSYDQQVKKYENQMPKCTAIGTPIKSESRFQRDFTNLEHLGKGAFGNVYKVKNIVDTREYAIKRIRLSKNSINHIEMVKEAQVLSNLDHKNIVRYYNCWIETSLLSDDSGKPKFDLDVGSSSSRSSDQDNNQDCLVSHFDSENKMFTYMYIQMEYCNGRTLRNIIDNKLYVELDRLRRLFKEMVEGLTHIHQQCIIHRDLKPDNIFIGFRDRIKIGDFGLATTCCIVPEFIEQSRLTSSIEAGNLLTGHVGTELYRAPEIKKYNSKYDQKVDIYSLGIMFFEMSCAPFSTVMERYTVLSDIRTESISLPQTYVNNNQNQSNVKLLRWLLSHDAGTRPTAQELLNSELIPPVKLETSEINKMICNTISQPQSQQYKLFVARFLDQESEAILDLTYSHKQWPANSVEFVKSKVLNLFRKHGAIEVVTPLLTPCSKNYVIDSNTVRLMTKFGTNIFLPYDLRLSFARHIIIKGINSIRRYSIDRVYREQIDSNFHPIQLHECAFDIVTPNPGNLLVDAELILIAYEIINELPALRQTNISIRINHTSLLRAVLCDFNIPPSKYDKVAYSLLEYVDGKMVKSKLKQILNEIVGNPRKTAVLFNVLMTEYSLVGTKKSMSGSKLENLIEGQGIAAELAKAAVVDIQTVVRLAQEFGVSCPITLLPGLPIGYERTKLGGIVWQMLAEEKNEQIVRRYILAAGERYDTFLSEFKKKVEMENEISGAGFSFSLENLMHAYVSSSAQSGTIERASVQVIVCVLGSNPPLKDLIEILKLLWTAGIYSTFVEAPTTEIAHNTARKLGARYLVVMNDDGEFILGTFTNQNIYQNRQITRMELIRTIQQMVEPNEYNFQAIHKALKRKIVILKQKRFKLLKKLKKIEEKKQLTTFIVKSFE